jgi:hypothetical protein
VEHSVFMVHAALLCLDAVGDYVPSLVDVASRSARYPIMLHVRSKLTLYVHARWTRRSWGDSSWNSRIG